MSLQRRVALAMAGVVALFVAVLGALAFLAVEAEEDALVDEIVQTEAQRLAGLATRGQLHQMDAEALREPGLGLSVWLVDVDGRTVPEPLPARLQGLADGVHRLGNPVEHLHVVAASTPAGRLVVQYDAARNEARVHEFGLYLAGLSLLCIALGAAVARRVAQLVVAPIEQLVVRLDAWAPDASLAAAGGSDEESRLLDSFGRVQARLEQAMAHEREFVANLAHEIRTPLSALRTDLEMLQAGSDSDRSVRLARSLAAVDAVAEALAAARAIQQRVPLAPRPTALAQCVDDAWGSLGTLAQQRGLRLVNLVPPQASALVDRHSLLTILRNLLRNAAEHAAPATCTVRGDSTGLEIIDDGPGIVQADLPFLFDRYWSGRLADARGAAPGSPAGAAPPVSGRPPGRGEPADPSDDRRGLGLAIAKQVADLNGWQLTAGSVAGQGTRFTLIFEGSPDAAAAWTASH